LRIKVRNATVRGNVAPTPAKTRPILSDTLALW